MLRNVRSTVDIQYRESGTLVKHRVGSKTLKEVEVPETHAQASVNLTLTKNLGNYESLKVSVGIVLPCATEKIETAVVEAKTLAERYLDRFVKEALTE